MNELGIESTGGFELALELTVKAFHRGVKIAEVPTTWSGPDRGRVPFPAHEMVAEIPFLVLLRPNASPQANARDTMTRTLKIESEGPLETVVDRICQSDPSRRKDSKNTDSAVVFGIVWRLLILIAFVMVTFPPCFGVMGTGLDASWVIGLNEASSRHMVYGRDIVFTYGPLGFMLIPLDLGSNLVHAILFRLGLHILWWTSVGMLLFRTRGFVATLLFAAASLLSGIQSAPLDVNFQLAGVMILTTIGYLVLGHLDRRPLWAVPAMIVSAGALLAKFNIGVACAGSIVVWAVIELLRDRSLRMLGRLGLLALTYVGTLGCSSESTAARSTPWANSYDIPRRSPPGIRRRCRSRGLRWSWRSSRRSWPSPSSLRLQAFC